MSFFFIQLQRALFYSAIILIWCAGIVLADGAYKMLALFFPPYSLYLVVELAMKNLGII